jgi:ribosomal protein S18 acetylase RimI-like enzyme
MGAGSRSSCSRQNRRLVDLTVRQIGAGDIVTGLSLGHNDFAPLKAYLRHDARKHHEQSLARTYAAFDDEDPQRVKAYVTLVCGEVVTENGENGLVVENGLHYPYRQYPAVKIARLAVDRRLAGQQIGRRLVELSIGISKDVICPAVGCRFIVVDAKKQSVGFYEKCGFTSLDTPGNRERDEPVMFIDLHKLPADE